MAIQKREMVTHEIVGKTVIVNQIHIGLNGNHKQLKSWTGSFTIRDIEVIS
jgi:hypothetical protein